MARGATKRSRLALAGALAGVVALGVAGGPAANADLASFNSTASGHALRVIVDLTGLRDRLPAAARQAFEDNYASTVAQIPAGSLPAGFPTTFPWTVDQTFLKTQSDASSNLTRALAVLGDGFQKLTERSSTSADQPGTYDMAQGQTDKLPPAFTDPTTVDVSFLSVQAGVLRALVAAGPKVDGSAAAGTIASTLANVSGALPNEVKDLVSAVVQQVNDALASGGTVDQAVDTVAGSVQNNLPPEVESALQGAGVNLNDLAGELNVPAQIQLPNPLTTTVATASEVRNATTAQRQGQTMSADAVSAVKSVNFLGGFLSVGAINLSSHSEAAGAKGSAKNTSSCSVADVRLGDANGVSIDGSKLWIDGVAVPVQAPAEIDSLKNEVRKALDLAGVTVDLCDQASAQAADSGIAASQSVSAFKVTLEPKVPAQAVLDALPEPLRTNAATALTTLGLNPADSLGIKIVVDPTVQTAVGMVATLPMTGAPAAATAALGFGLTALAIIGRRRAIG